jgi:nucleotide-binding universal stress UspA family protein
METTEFKKVLIALDYNPTSQKIAEQGYSIAKSMGAECILMHVITDPVFYSTQEYSPILGLAGHMDMNQIQFDDYDELKKVGQHFMNSIKYHLNDSTIQTVIKMGNIADSITATAEEINAEIVVVGSHSQRWMENILIGSVAEKVLRQSPVLIVIVPTKKLSN